MQQMMERMSVEGDAREEVARRRRVWGVALAALGIFWVLSLLSYRVEEVSWGYLNRGGNVAEGCSNWMGVVGMYAAGVMYRLFGMGALYGAVLMMAPALGMVIWPRERRGGQWVAWAVMVITACAAFSMQGRGLGDGAQGMQIRAVGGELGYLDGVSSTQALLGKYWGTALMLLVHAVALIYFARLTPKVLYTAEKRDVATLAERWRAWRERRRRAAAARHVPWQERAREVGTVPARDGEVSAPVAPPRERAPRSEQAPEGTETPPELLSPPEEERETKPRERRHTRPAGHAPARGDNLLDLMEQVEEDIARRNAPGAEDEEEEELPINAHTQAALERHLGIRTEDKKPTRSREAAKPTKPASQPKKVRPTRKAPVQEEYPLPPYELLKYEPVSESVRSQAREEMLRKQSIIADALESFRISVQPGDITRGPSVTRYEFSVPRGQSVKAVAGRSKDIQLVTESRSVNILAPIPGKSTVGVELENSIKEPVYLRELLQSDEFHDPKVRIPVALGKDVYGNPVIGDLAAMPHVLVAGSTGSGKSVCINSMLISFLYKFRPDELKLILVDPKVVEMQPYKKLPHLAVPVVTDPTRVIGALRWAVNEMEHRYSLFSKMGVRNLADYNALPPDAQPVTDDEDEPSLRRENPDAVDAIVRDVESSRGCDIPEEDEEEQGELDFTDDGSFPSRLPYVVIVIDELADLMSQVKEDLENYIQRLTAKARAAGIHMIVATQSPRAQVVTGIIKSNLTSRIALKVSSQLDSRVILDERGAENLLGKGDLLFLPPGGPSKMARAQGAFVSDAEIASIIQFCASHAKQNFVQSAAMAVNNAGSEGPSVGRNGSASEEEEELYTRCVNLVVTERKASTSLLQRRFSIGYSRAAKIMDMMEERGVISPPQGANRARDVLVEPS